MFLAPKFRKQGLGSSDYDIDSFIDSQSLFNAVYLLTSLLGKRLRLYG